MSRLPDFRAAALEEAARLGPRGAARLLQQGTAWSERWGLPETLRSGGALLFPHLGLARCGAHTAAVVCAALDACQRFGQRRVLALGVLHARTRELEIARERVARAGDPAAEPSWGIQGPGATAMVRTAARRDWHR
ncbi:MAG: hypothetical protein GF330_13195, partial [Candidatus Eisenbacteria bacterium]|nr:hypothetical protein [Candidatus Eisenbacteria bacterium]